jgi:hypothetical protein
MAEVKTDVAGLKTDMAEVKTDVAGLKTDMAETKGQLGRLEVATKRGFDRVDARLEMLIGYIVRSETGST